VKDHISRGRARGRKEKRLPGFLAEKYFYDVDSDQSELFSLPAPVSTKLGGLVARTSVQSVVTLV
jgi:hypothetical protein